jgi:hypothetical protein
MPIQTGDYRGACAAGVIHANTGPVQATYHQLIENIEK